MAIPQFARYVGIDYSGAGTPDERLSGLQAYACKRGGRANRVLPSGHRGRAGTRWSRRSLFAWLSQELQHETPLLVGIDHGFSFPKDYFDRYELRSWNAFLSDFATHWPTDQQERTVEGTREEQRGQRKRVGKSSDLRLTEKWTTSAKSVFQFDVQGQVAKSTHAGLPWIHRLRQERRKQLHFWPFDGWEVPENKSVIAEVYPSLVRKRYGRNGRTVDQQDAYSVCRWFGEMDARGALPRFFNPPLSPAERRLAKIEGWILGVC